MVRHSITGIASVLLLVALGAQISGCGKGKETVPTPPAVRHVLLYKAGGWKGVLAVNGIPVDLIMSPEGAIPITEWTQTGQNELAIVAQKEADTKEPFQFQVCTATSPDMKDIKPDSAPVAIPVPTDGPAAIGSAAFQAPPRDEWPWQKAVALENITPDDQKEIQDVFMRFCLAFQNRNVDDVLNVITVGSKIKAQALGITYEQARANDRAMLEKIFANATNINIINPNDAQVRPFARGVMVFPVNLDGSMHLVNIDDKNDPNNSYIFDFLTLCKIDGKWVRVN